MVVAHLMERLLLTDEDISSNPIVTVIMHYNAMDSKDSVPKFGGISPLWAISCMLYFVFVKLFYIRWQIFSDIGQIFFVVKVQRLKNNLATCSLCIE